jgi:hypothetical protein
MKIGGNSSRFSSQRRKNKEGPTTVAFACISCCFTSRSLFIYFLFCFLFRAEIVDGDKSLVIKNVVPSDEGIYVCEAQNSVGQITSKAQLVVNCEYHNDCLFVLFVVFCYFVSCLGCLLLGSVV